MTVRVTASIDVPVGPAAAFASLADLPSQERWIPATKLFAIDAPVAVPHVGSRLAAFTGFGGVGFLDVMVVTKYEPPLQWVMAKEGSLLRGIGIMQVTPLLDGCRVTWANELELPLGVIGRAGWVLVRPIARLALYAALRRLARQLKSGALPLAATARTAPA